ncbi:hypothetical protein FRC10_003707 [Ceratobasidium sp. 414]|nr:hypothetical protein FRC10_003707 [Ceratobasidium sp. 414]
MLSTKILTVLALLTVSASGLSVGHSSSQPAHRRHAARAARNSVLGARAARAPEGAEAGVIARRDALPAVRKRGIQARRCAPKSSTSVFPSSTLVPDASSASAEATTSSADPTPEPTTSTEPTTTDEPTSTSKPATKTSSSVKPTPTNDGSSSSGDTYTGEATFYATGLGACGITNNDSQFIAAASHLLFDGFSGYTGGDPNQNPICNRKVTAHYQGKSVSVILTDRCVGCAKYDLDFSPAAFDQLADESLGRLKGMTWSFD